MSPGLSAVPSPGPPVRPTEEGSAQEQAPRERHVHVQWGVLSGRPAAAGAHRTDSCGLGARQGPLSTHAPLGPAGIIQALFFHATLMLRPSPTLVVCSPMAGTRPHLPWAAVISPSLTGVYSVRWACPPSHQPCPL